jgi:hypothetical protein
MFNSFLIMLYDLDGIRDIKRRNKDGSRHTMYEMRYSKPVSLTFLLVVPFWLRKITTDPHILADVNIACPDDTYPKLKIYTLELIFDRC